MHIARDTAHVVVHRGQHGYRVLVDVDSGEYPRGLGDTRQSFLDDGGTQVLEMQLDMVLECTDASALANLDRHRAADDVARRQVLGIRGVALHESLAGGVRQIPALAARAFRDQTAGAIDACGMELHEFHVLQGQACAQGHAAAVTRTSMGGRA